MDNLRRRVRQTFKFDPFAKMEEKAEDIIVEESAEELPVCAICSKEILEDEEVAVNNCEEQHVFHPDCLK